MTTTESTTTGHDKSTNYYQAGVDLSHPDYNKFVELDKTVEMIRQARDQAQGKIGVPGVPSYDDLLHVIDMLTEKMDKMVQGHHLSIVNGRNINDKLNRFRRDIETMNDILNDAAEGADLCESYENTLDEVNCNVSSFHLTGRQRDWTATISVTVQVQATTEDDADEMAREIERSILNNGDSTYMIVGADYDSNTISLAY